MPFELRFLQLIELVLHGGLFRTDLTFYTTIPWGTFPALLWKRRRLLLITIKILPKIRIIDQNFSMTKMVYVTKIFRSKKFRFIQNIILKF